MGLFDYNIHRNGMGTEYQSFLDIAAAAEKKGDGIANRTVRLVKKGDGLATTTSLGLKGARAEQIDGARKAFLDAIVRTYGFEACEKAKKVLGDGVKPVPLTARRINAVNEALGDKKALSGKAAFIRKHYVDFTTRSVFEKFKLGDSMKMTDAEKEEFDLGRIESETTKILVEKYGEDFVKVEVEDGNGLLPDADPPEKPRRADDGTLEKLRGAISEATARVAAAVRLATLLRAAGVSGKLARELAEKTVGENKEAIGKIFEENKDPSGKIEALVAPCLGDNAERIEEDFVAGAKAKAEKLIADAVETGLVDKDEREESKVMEDLDKRLGRLKDEANERRQNGKTVDGSLFRKSCDLAVARTAKAYIVRERGADLMVRADGGNRIGANLYDLLNGAAGDGEKPRIVGWDFHTKLLESVAIRSGGLKMDDLKQLEREGFRMVLWDVTLDWAKHLLESGKEHPELETHAHEIVGKIANGFLDRFMSVATQNDLERFVVELKTVVRAELDRVNASLWNIDTAEREAQAELEDKVAGMAGQYGIAVTDDIKATLAKMLDQEKKKVQTGMYLESEVKSVADCRKALVDRVEKKWLDVCRQSADEVAASGLLDENQKKTFISWLLKENCKAAHVKIALRTVKSIDATAIASGIASAAAKGDGIDLAAQLSRLTGDVKDRLGEDDIKQIDGSDEEGAFVGVVAELADILNPQIVQNCRNLGPEARQKMFGEATEEMKRQTSTLRATVGNPASKPWELSGYCILHLQKTCAE